MSRGYQRRLAPSQHLISLKTFMCRLMLVTICKALCSQVHFDSERGGKVDFNCLVQTIEIDDFSDVGLVITTGTAGHESLGSTFGSCNALLPTECRGCRILSHIKCSLESAISPGPSVPVDSRHHLGTVSVQTTSF